MKLSLLQFLLFVFISMWVLGDVAGTSNDERMYWCIIMTFGIAYLNNAHGKFWNWIKSRKTA
jgi:hypothetical protein